MDVEFEKCDISSLASIDEFKTSIESKYDHIDILVNNGAIAFKGSDPTPFEEQAEPTIQTNFFGTLYLTKVMLPLLKLSNSPRVVNVASMAGHLKILKSPELVASFTDPNLTLEQLEGLMNEFVIDVKSGTHGAKGWPNTCYGMSKLGVIAMSKVLARDEPNVVVNACCPGWCATDMSGHSGPRSSEEGARTPAYLAMLPPSPSCPSGLFFKDEAPVEW